MASTSRVNITNGQWVLVADGKPNVIVQRLTSVRVEAYVASSAPSNDAKDIGHPLWSDEPTVSFAELASTDKVYVRSAPGEDGKVCVTA